MTDRNLATLLDQALRSAGIPIVGVSIGQAADRLTWKIEFDAAATTQQKVDAQAIIKTFDPLAPEVLAAEQTKAAQLALGSLTAKAFLAAVLELKLGRPLTKDDVPALRQLFAQGAGYYAFIIQHGL